MTWNIRVMNTDDKISQVFTLLKTHKLTLLSLVENKLSTEPIANLNFRFVHWSVLHNNDTGSKGRILVLVDAEAWTYDVIRKSHQRITILLTNKGGLQLYYILIHASNSFVERLKLWDLLCKPHL